MMQSEEPKKKKTMIDYLLTVLLVAAVAVFLFAGYKLYSIYREYKIGTDEYKALEELAVKKHPVKENGDGVAVPEGAAPPIEVDFAALKAINDDVVGWLYVDALGLSYPIVQGSSNEQYLHTTYEGTYNFAGSIFIDFENSRDFKDPHTIVFGHNMRNGSMFGMLSRFRTSDAYATSPYFWILTPENNYRYQIFSIHNSAVTGETYTLFMKHNEEYEQYLTTMKQLTEVDTGDLVPAKTDNIVTLSTCTGDSSSRLVVQGVQIK